MHTHSATTTFARRLYERRTENRLSQPKLARRIHCTPNAISVWESQTNDRLPSAPYLEALDAALGTGDELRRLAAIARTTVGAVKLRRGVQLPAPPPWLVGRDADLDSLTAQLQAPTPMPMVVDGPAGVGKTAVALTVAHRLRGHYPDKVLYLRLGGHTGRGHPACTPEELLSTALATVTHARQPTTGLDACRATLAAALHDRRVLLVLDDADHSEQIRSLLPDAPECGVLITSRHRLGGLSVTHGAQHHTLAPLADEHAEQLLAATMPDGTDSQDMRRIATACDGSPLALHAVAEHARAHRQLPVSELAGFLEGPKRARVLGAVGRREDTAASLPARLDVSVSHLSDGAHRLLVEAAQAGCSRVCPEQAAGLTGASIEEAEDWVDELAGEHLLDADYRLSDLVAEHARGGHQPAPAAGRRLHPVRIPC